MGLFLYCFLVMKTSHRLEDASAQIKMEATTEKKLKKIHMSATVAKIVCVAVGPMREVEEERG